MSDTFKYLVDKYSKAGLTRKNLANELTCSLSTVDRSLKEGMGLPSHIRIGSGERARIIFPIAEVARFLDEQLIAGRENFKMKNDEQEKVQEDKGWSQNMYITQKKIKDGNPLEEEIPLTILRVCP